MNLSNALKKPNGLAVFKDTYLSWFFQIKMYSMGLFWDKEVENEHAKNRRAWMAQL
ncbi:hypothetical protein QWY85_02240 [Neolewinella lacunae]|uniref:Uncharacterized protein n=1 Tax=Neolewinella lacunae TaxID=1517758 RepID=A0A923PGB5_9BACT|nr:hypothetical protein [Neolewinella lacunae]MBC6993608.1 hypothetical protein [Neolewinella lacunae]MDN3633460.1 hypothetical protein [Neolewinella lacunae]